MTDTDHTDDLLHVNGVHAAVRLVHSQKLEPGSPHLAGQTPPTHQQISATLHALADHTLNGHMLRTAEQLGADRAGLGPDWAATTGLGRYLQQMGDRLDAGYQPDGQDQPTSLERENARLRDDQLETITVLSELLVEITGRTFTSTGSARSMAETVRREVLRKAAE
ncbi:hypothetical protein ACFVAJ_17995 [Agromyces sp. NPDC057679]|uniref:hypothetical protein n=1 Tax=Agromyces sp. NPDC057679 TaxID=3346207 RepID=UPI00367174E7